MATLTAVFVPDYANTISVTGTTGTLAANAASGPIVIGQHRLIQINVKDTTTPGSIAQISFTLGLSTGTAAPTPLSTSPFFSVTQSLVFDLGQYDSINVANFHNGADAIDYSITILSKF